MQISYCSLASFRPVGMGRRRSGRMGGLDGRIRSLLEPLMCDVSRFKLEERWRCATTAIRLGKLLLHEILYLQPAVRNRMQHALQLHTYLSAPHKTASQVSAMVS